MEIQPNSVLRTPRMSSEPVFAARNSEILVGGRGIPDIAREGRDERLVGVPPS